MEWFRFYHKAVDDPKVQRLAPPLFKHWVNLLCLASRNAERGTLPSLADLAFGLRLPDGKVRAILADLVAAELIDRDGETLRMHDWPVWQKRSDDVTARVSKHRAGNGSETLQETPFETLPHVRATETETERDTELTPPAPPKSANGHAAAAAESYRSVIGEQTCSAVAEQFRRIDASLVPGWFGGMLRNVQTHCGPASRPQLEEAVKVTLSELERRLAAERNGGGGTPVVSVKKFTEAVFQRNLSDALSAGGQ